LKYILLSRLQFWYKERLINVDVTIKSYYLQTTAYLQNKSTTI